MHISTFFMGTKLWELWKFFNIKKFLFLNFFSKLVTNKVISIFPLMKARFRKNVIVALETIDGALDNVDEVKAVVKNHFACRFAKQVRRLNLDILNFKSLLRQDSEELEALFFSFT